MTEPPDILSGTPTDPTLPKLETLGDVQRALARLCRRVDRRKMNLAKAAELRQCLMALASLMQDRRDSRWVARAKVLWKQHAEGNEKAPALPVSNH